MNKNLFLAIMLIVVPIAATAQPIISIEHQENLKNDSQWKKVAKMYATTLVAGGLIGGITGKLSYCAIDKMMNKNLEPWPLLMIAILMAESNFRTKWVHELNQSFDEYGVKHKRNLTSDIAWLASWVAWFI